MKIDLHCHTKKTKIGDPETRNVTPELFARKITNSGVEIVAITNHNVFDIEQFRELEKSVLSECLLWPGIEFDVKCIHGNGHMLVICNPDNIDQFSKVVDAFTTGYTPDTFIATLDNVVKSFEPLDVVFIPHHYKEPEFSDDDLKELQKYTHDQSRIFVESVYRSVGILSTFKNHVLTGSDVRNWNEYDAQNLPELRLPIESFTQFCLLAAKDEQVITTLLNRKKPYTVKVTPAIGETLNLTLYPDINVLFGQKGTGKSIILSSLLSHFENQGKSCEVYFGSKKEEDFSIFEKIDFESVSCDKLVSNDCHREFDSVLSWKEVKITDFSDYIESFETASAKKSRRELRITETPLIDPPPVSTVISDYSSAVNISQSVNTLLDKQYVSMDIATQIRNLFAELVGAILTTYRTSWIEENSIFLSNNLVERFRYHADTCTGSKSRPHSTGFRQFAEARLNLASSLHTIIKSIKDVPEATELEFLGLIEGKGSLSIRTRCRFLCKESTAKEYLNTITPLRSIYSELESLLKKFFLQNIGEKIVSLRENCITRGIKDLSSFVGIRKDYVLNDTTTYNPSNGEKGIILIERVLNKSADVYLLDEPEMGMGSSFINTLIIPQLNALARQKKTVVIATHNANIAVRTLPYMSILRDHKNGQYFTFLGNPFSDTLIEIDNRDQQRSWTEESMHLLEGGREAFYERKRIYES